MNKEVLRPALVIGASGQVGGNLLACLKNERKAATGTCCTHPVPGLERVDVIDALALEKFIQAFRPGIVYFPAALANVDFCQQHPREAYEVNVRGTSNMIRACNAVGARLVFFSTDYLFSGSSGPYTEDDLPDPIQVYGWQKLLGEHLVATRAENYLIVRTTVVYGWEGQRKNFAVRIIQSLREGKVTRVPFDQVGNPTYAPDLASAVIQLAEQERQNGVFHMAGPDRASRYEFALKAAQIFQLDEDLVRPVATSELNQPGPRPLQAGLVSLKAEKQVLHRFTGIEAGLEDMRLREEAI